MKSFQITVAIEESLDTFEETSENSGAGGKKYFSLLGQMFTRMETFISLSLYV